MTLMLALAVLMLAFAVLHSTQTTERRISDVEALIQDLFLERGEVDLASRELAGIRSHIGQVLSILKSRHPENWKGKKPPLHEPLKSAARWDWQ